VTQPDNVASFTHTRIAIDTLAWLIHDAFEGDPSHSLMANVQGLSEQDWTALPPSAGRSIADIFEHVAWSKWMYNDYAFGSATLRGDQPPLVPRQGVRARPHQDLLAWLTDGHRRWLASVRALDDAELERERLTNWGERLPTRAIIRIMIAHDFYHAGEINHLRALLHRTDHWPYE
jgi:uncharacterized damage-inducible protein DinB